MTDIITLADKINWEKDKSKTVTQQKIQEFFKKWAKEDWSKDTNQKEFWKNYAKNIWLKGTLDKDNKTITPGADDTNAATKINIANTAKQAFNDIMWGKTYDINNKNPQAAAIAALHYSIMQPLLDTNWTSSMLWKIWMLREDRIAKYCTSFLCKGNSWDNEDFVLKDPDSTPKTKVNSEPTTVSIRNDTEKNREVPEQKQKQEKKAADEGAKILADNLAKKVDVKKVEINVSSDAAISNLQKWNDRINPKEINTLFESKDYETSLAVAQKLIGWVDQKSVFDKLYNFTTNKYNEVWQTLINNNKGNNMRLSSEADKEIANILLFKLAQNNPKLGSFELKVENNKDLIARIEQQFSKNTINWPSGWFSYVKWDITKNPFEALNKVIHADAIVKPVAEQVIAPAPVVDTNKKAEAQATSPKIIETRSPETYASLKNKITTSESPNSLIVEIDGLIKSTVDAEKKAEMEKLKVGMIISQFNTINVVQTVGQSENTLNTLKIPFLTKRDSTKVLEDTKSLEIKSLGGIEIKKPIDIDFLSIYNGKFSLKINLDNNNNITGYKFETPLKDAANKERQTITFEK